ncbi:hypothetical protein D9613_002754 [Agrocybe pediades]|uniref:Uncharacterized protein n=1 Tax=Agrocybe pediades TaxID=84607 RepID=A0A8H4QPH6_9AGAR|nr:hypothetical protein D9613_002754 [Agrocybe pediades]
MTLVPRSTWIGGTSAQANELIQGFELLKGKSGTHLQRSLGDRGVCNNGSFPIEVLPAMSHYLGPTLQTANPCQCNTVTYSLMSACGACQGRTYLSWSVWSANCPTVSINTYPEPIPSGVAIPGWAYLDVKATDNFDPTLAKENSNLTESTAIPSPTSTRLTSTITIHLSTTSSRASASSTSSSVLTTTTSSSSSSSPEQVRRENAIGGGVVGGLAGLLLILALLFWFIKRRRRLARNGQHLPSPSPTPADPENPTWHEGPYMRQANLNPAPQMSPAVSDGRTFPRWSTYKTNCSAVYDEVFLQPIPPNTKVPHYAYLDVVTSDTFNATLAQAAGGVESTNIPAPTSSSSDMAPGGNPTGDANNGDANNGASKKSNAGAIAGGVVGGLVGLAIIVCLVLWLLRRRRRAAPSSSSFGPGMMASRPMTAASTTYPSTPAPKVYDPNDPSTYPSNMPNAFTPSPEPMRQHTGYVTPNYTGNSGQMVYNQTAKPTYTGAPEL